jgi:hypothetical protein
MIQVDHDDLIFLPNWDEIVYSDNAAPDLGLCFNSIPHSNIDKAF